MRWDYLKEYRPGLFNTLVRNGTLYLHLAEVDEAAQRRLDVLIPQLAKAAGATEELKARDPLAWVGLINNCEARLEEIIQKVSNPGQSLIFAILHHPKTLYSSCLPLGMMLYSLCFTL